MLTCREIVHLVTEYLDGAMPPEQRIRFERHIAICPPCRAFLAQVRETIHLSGKLTEESLSPKTRDALVSAFRDWKREE